MIWAIFSTCLLAIKCDKQLFIQENFLFSLTSFIVRLLYLL